MFAIYACTLYWQMITVMSRSCAAVDVYMVIIIIHQLLTIFIIYSCTDFFPPDLCKQIISTHCNSRFRPIVSVSNN